MGRGEWGSGGVGGGGGVGEVVLSMAMPVLVLSLLCN